MLAGRCAPAPRREPPWEGLRYAGQHDRQSQTKLETRIGGGANLRKLGGGGLRILNFRGSLNLTLFYTDSTNDPQFGGQKSKLSKDNFRGEFPPPSDATGHNVPLPRSPTKGLQSPPSTEPRQQTPAGAKSSNTHTHTRKRNTQKTKRVESRQFQEDAFSSVLRCQVHFVLTQADPKMRAKMQSTPKMQSVGMVTFLAALSGV